MTGQRDKTIDIRRKKDHNYTNNRYEFNWFDDASRNIKMDDICISSLIGNQKRIYAKALLIRIWVVFLYLPIILLFKFVINKMSVKNVVNIHLLRDKLNHEFNWIKQHVNGSWNNIMKFANPFWSKQD